MSIFWFSRDNLERLVRDIKTYMTEHSISTFVGTRAEWTALSATEKAKYRIVHFTDDNPNYNDLSNSVVDFTSYDVSDANATTWTSVPTLISGETSLSSMFSSVSKMLKNVRYLFKILGTTDISQIGDGTVTGIVNALNTSVNGLSTNFSDIRKAAKGVSPNFKLLATVSASGTSSVDVTVNTDEYVGFYVLLGVSNWYTSPTGSFCPISIIKPIYDGDNNRGFVTLNNWGSTEVKVGVRYKSGTASRMTVTFYTQTESAVARLYGVKF